LCVLWKTCETYGTLGQGILMKANDSILIPVLAVFCLLTGCGKEIEQNTVSAPEETSVTLPSETTRAVKAVYSSSKTTAITTETTIPESSGTATSGSAETSGTARSTAVSTETSSSGEELATTAVTVSPETQIIIEYQDDDEIPVSQGNGSYSGNNGSVRRSTTKKSGTTAVTSSTTTVTMTETELPAESETEPETELLTEPETEPETEPLRKSGTVPEILSMMTLEEKIYQLFIVTPEVLTNSNLVTAAGERTHNAIVSQPVAGLIYFADNLTGWNQTSTMLANTQAYARESGIGMFLAVDEEGGLVARCAKKLGTTSFNPMATYGKSNDWNTAYWIGQTLGSDIGQFGFNLDFAPVADVNLSSGNELGTRIFSDDPYVVGNMVSGVVQGLQSTGTAATLKHFPGLGAENGNAHYDDKIIIDRTLDDLRNAEFIPFQYGIDAGADFVMVSHQIITGAGDNLPACLSPVVCTDWLRGELGFDGVLVTDAFNMNTISGSYSPGESAVMAIEAGVDIILMPTDLTGSVQALETAVENGRISEERINQSAERILIEKEKLNLLG